MNTQEAVKSKMLKVAALAVGGFLVILVSFAGGVAVGLKKARFSYKWGENYERNFMGGPLRGPMGMKGQTPGPREMMRDFEGRGFRNAHGIAGSVISVADNKIVIKDRNGQENTISVDDKTLIKRGQDNISLNDLKNGDRIVVMGSPDDNGVVKADLIRVFSANENK